MKRIADSMRQVELPPAMLRFSLLIAGMAALSFAYTETMTRVFKLSYPYGSPIFFKDERWFDFLVYRERFGALGTPGFWAPFDYPFTYPAPLALMYAALYKIPHALRFILPGYVALAMGAGLILVQCLKARGISQEISVAFTAALLLASEPLRALLESANTEGFVAILAALGVYAVLRERWWLAATLLAIAGSMKIFPFILLALLLSKRRYKEFAGALVIALVATMTSLMILGPTMVEAQRHINAGIHYVKYIFIFSRVPSVADFNHSLFTPIKFAALFANRHLHPMTETAGENFVARALRERLLLETIYNIYMPFAAGFGIGIYFGWIRWLPILNQVIALSACALVLPPLSADYTLIHLLFPFALLCCYAAEQWRNSVPVSGLTACFTCFAFIFAYQTYMTLKFRFSCEVRTLALIVLVCVVMRYRFETPGSSGIAGR